MTLLAFAALPDFMADVRQLLSSKATATTRYALNPDNSMPGSRFRALWPAVPKGCGATLVSPRKKSFATKSLFGAPFILRKCRETVVL